MRISPAIVSPPLSSAAKPAEEGERPEAQQAVNQQRELAALRAEDRRVRAHERAHQVTGGRYAGAPRLDFEKGPDGQNYAVSGEVPIDTAVVPGDPAATAEKMRVVISAALAPVDPSAQDRRIAAEARRELFVAELAMLAERQAGDAPPALDVLA